MIASLSPVEAPRAELPYHFNAGCIADVYAALKLNPAQDVMAHLLKESAKLWKSHELSVDLVKAADFVMETTAMLKSHAKLGVGDAAGTVALRATVINHTQLDSFSVQLFAAMLQDGVKPAPEYKEAAIQLLNMRERQSLAYAATLANGSFAPRE